MQLLKNERIKSYILIVLIILSFIQIGILLSYQSHGLPIGFFASIFRSVGKPDFVSFKNIRDEYFVPFRLAVSDGQSSHWLIDKDDELYKKIWDGTKTYLNTALSGKQPSGGDIWPVEQKWAELVIKKGILVEFRSSIGIGLIKWFLDINAENAGGPYGVHKIMVIPGDGVVERSTYLYITDGQMVYRYIIYNSISELIGDGFDGIINKLKTDKKYELKSYWVMKNIDPANKLPFTYSPEILCVVQRPAYRNYRNISYLVPEKIFSAGSDEVAELVLASEKFSYDGSVDYEDTIIFKNQDNLYRIYKNGLLEYRYISSHERVSEEEIDEAFVQACSFIKRISENFVSGAGIYLSGARMNRTQGTFEFRFDYMVDEIPVVFDYNSGMGGGKSASNAIVIEANGKRVLYCKWMLKEFNQGSKVIKYDARAENVINELLKFSGLSVKDILAAYVVSSDEGTDVGPSWVVEKADGERHIVMLNRE
ncbi:MAG TPA: hypothetical protein GXX14_13995 [Clostridiaceae bacterium]|nr:hypothetical protein [Clostridiaceae bacterium]